jgi:uncharacterized protein involved in cysteine biosynthesis
MEPVIRGSRSFIFGLTLPWRAASTIIRSPALLAASILPLALSVTLDAWLIHRMQQGLSEWIRSQTSGAIAWVALLLVWVALFIAGFLAFSLIAGIAALPFNDWLAELTESRASPPMPAAPKTGWLGKVKHLLIDLFKTLCALFLSVVALFFSWLPGLNLIGLGLAFLLIAFQFLSYPQTRRGMGALDGARFIARHPWSCLGFGISFAFLFALPLISSLALPLAVVGGTLLFARDQANPAH